MMAAARLGLATFIRRSFLTGLLVIVPSCLTFWLCWSGFRWIDASLIWLLRGLPIEPYPGTGFVLGFGLVVAVGAFASNFLGKRVVELYETLLHRVPVVNQLFPALRQVASVLFAEHRTAFEKVVLVEYPRRGTYVLGFLAEQAPAQVSAKTPHPTLLSIFIPTTPNPTSGFLLLVPSEDVTELEMSPDAGLKLIISGGLLKPEELKPAASEAPESTAERA